MGVQLTQHETLEDLLDSETHSGVVALLGPPNAGKSTLLNRAVGLKIAPETPKAQTTQRGLRGIVMQGDDQIIFIDTPGMSRKENELGSFLQREAFAATENIDACVWMLDALHVQKSMDQGTSLDEAKHPLNAFAATGIAERVRRARKVLVLNKIDRLEDKHGFLPLVEYLNALNVEQKFGFEEIVPISARKGRNVGKLLSLLVASLPKQPYLLDPTLFTDAPESTVVREVLREKLMLFLGQEVPYRVAVQIDRFDESQRETKKNIVHIDATLHVERDSLKGMVLGKGGSMLKKIGVAARKDAESLLDAKVMLKLFVKVTKDWTQSDKGLKSVGYQNT